MEIIVKQRIAWDVMSIKAELPSGAKFKLKVNRNGEDLEVAFSNNSIIAKKQFATFKIWLNQAITKHKDWKIVFNELENYAKQSINSTIFIDFLQNDINPKNRIKI